MNSFSEIIRKIPMPKVNKYLMQTIREEDLAEYVIDAFKTITCGNKYLDIIDYEVITDESKFDPDLVNLKHIKNPKLREEMKNVIDITESRYNMLNIKFKITAPDKCGEFVLPLLLFKPYKKYFYLSKGNRYYPIFQLIETSTYATKDYLILKTLILPIIVLLKNKTIIDTLGNEYYVPDYRMKLFKKKIQPFLYWAASMGFDNTLKYLSLDEVLFVENESREDDNKFYTFTINGETYVNVYRYFFDNDNFVQNIVYEILDITKDISYKKIHKRKTKWATKKLGEYFVDPNKSYEKGCDLLFSYSRLLDNITRKNLKLSQYNKCDPFALMRWMLQNFDELKSKDVMDLSNKRIREKEYIVAPLIKHLSTRMIRFMKIKGITYENVVDLINIDKHKLINLNSGKKSLLRYDGVVNDMDFFTACKYTIKGPQAVGESSKRAIPMDMRDLHPSYIKKLDLNTCSTSDPGLSGVVNPFQELHSKNFDDTPEIQNWYKNFKRKYKKFFKEEYEVKDLDYFYGKKNDNKKIRFLHDANNFIRNNPYLNKQNTLHDKVKIKGYNIDDDDYVNKIVKNISSKKNTKIIIKINAD